jgi:hypothetical protein
MKRMARVIGPIVCVLGLAACASSSRSTGAPAVEPAGYYEGGRCRIAGSECRWDRQCCTGRCYVDTGCSG